MLYDVPPNELDIIGKNGQTVFCWLVEKIRAPKTLNDQYCIAISSKSPMCVCARIAMDKNKKLIENLKVNLEVDICFLLQNEKVLWQRKNPVEEVIEQIMKEALEIGLPILSKIKAKISPNASVDNSMLFVLLVDAAIQKSFIGQDDIPPLPPPRPDKFYYSAPMPPTPPSQTPQPPTPPFQTPQPPTSYLESKFDQLQDREPDVRPKENKSRFSLSPFLKLKNKSKSLATNDEDYYENPCPSGSQKSDGNRKSIFERVSLSVKKDTPKMKPRENKKETTKKRPQSKL